ncbi:glycoside hydrolase domain-containing protein [Pilimelia columellifera]|uniref:DUF1906 domain-containing protein n=1 Tax=Pilimelia columellifera subsp. columellifera TaxID=706583 RepID=A0ABN3NKK0_9ACTN
MSYETVRIGRRALFGLAGAVAGVALIGRAEAAPGLPPRLFDDMVLRAQRWVNATYGNRPKWKPAPEDGRTGTDTVTALVRALQHEVGMDPSVVNGAFGPATLSLVTEKIGQVAAGKPANIIKIAQSGLYCKGYPGDQIGGVWGAETQRSVSGLRRDMGLTDGRGTLTPNELRGLLTMDAYQLLPGGVAAVRRAQQWLNQRYASQPAWFAMGPADGLVTRQSLARLVSAVQWELGITSPTGEVGPATLAGLRKRTPITVGDADAGGAPFVQLLHAALIFNRNEAPWSSTFSAASAAQVRKFQTFVGLLPANGAGDGYTWASLLIANGDPSRPANAADCSTPLTPARAATLRAAGATVVGRYLTNVGNFNKKLQPGELATVFAAGLRVFPIYQTSADTASYFTAAQGRADVQAAIAAARGYGFRNDTIIYFAVDYDAYPADIASGVLPYFTALKATMDAAGSPYRVGAYGVRNVCIQLEAAGLAVTSFVADIAHGYDGNLGYPLPSNWAFDQFATVTLGVDDARIEFDKNVASGRDPGQASVEQVAAT